MKKMHQKGFAHWVMPLVVVGLIAVVGATVVTGSHADNITLSTANTASSSSASATNVNDVIILNASNSTHASAASDIPFDEIGTQTVDYLKPGDSLSYDHCSFDYVGCNAKGTPKACYYLAVQEPASGTTTANASVELTNGSNHVTKTLTSGIMANAGSLKQVCVNAGTKQNPGFNVKNLTPVAQGTVVEVYQEVITL